MIFLNAINIVHTAENKEGRIQTKHHLNERKTDDDEFREIIIRYNGHRKYGFWTSFHVLHFLQNSLYFSAVIPQ